MRSKTIIALLFTSMLTIPSAASATELTDSDVAAMREEIAALRTKIATLESRVDMSTIANTSSTPATPQEKPKTKVSWKGGPDVSSSDGWSFKPRGRLLVDAAHVGAPAGINDAGLGFSNEVRRVRLGVSGTVPGGFGYKIEADFAGADVEMTDALLSYKDGPLNLTVGQHNSFQSLEELTSSNDSSFMERAAFTDAFGFKRRLGVSGQYAKGDILLQGGVFTDNFIDLGNDENDTIGVDGRVVYAPKLGRTQLHFGASTHWRDLGNALGSVRYRQRPLVHSTDTRFISTPNIAADQIFGTGLEAAFISGRVHGMAEAHWQHVDRTGGANPTFFGGAVEAGIFLTNDTRSYKGGVFKGVKVKKPVGEGGIGAVQFNIRYDYLDLTDAGIVGGTQNGYMASLIWTPVDYVRFMINYARLDYRDAIIPVGGNRNYGVDSLGARAQIAF